MIQVYSDTKIWGYRDMGIQGYRETGQGYRGIKEYRDTGIQGLEPDQSHTFR